MEHVRPLFPQDRDHPEESLDVLSEINVPADRHVTMRGNAGLHELVDERAFASGHDLHLEIVLGKAGGQVIDIALGAAPVRLGYEDEYLQGLHK